MTPTRERALALGLELIDRGFDVHLSARNSAHQGQPCLRITSAEHTAFVYTAVDPQTGDGVCRFWWASLDPIGPADDVAGAVDAIIAELGPPLHHAATLAS